MNSVAYVDVGRSKSNFTLMPVSSVTGGVAIITAGPGVVGVVIAAGPVVVGVVIVVDGTEPGGDLMSFQERFLGRAMSFLYAPEQDTLSLGALKI